jgi:hypothetical protein
MSLNSNQERLAVEKSLQELESIRNAFIELQKVVDSCYVSEFFSDPIKDFAEIGVALEHVINNTPPDFPDERKMAKLAHMHTMVLTKIYERMEKHHD